MGDFSAKGMDVRDFGRALTRTLVDAGRRGVSGTGAILLSVLPPRRGPFFKFKRVVGDAISVRRQAKEGEGLASESSMPRHGE